LPEFDAGALPGSRDQPPAARRRREAAGVAAAALALAASGWTPAACAAEPVGLVAGTMFAGMHTIAEFDRRALEAGPQYVMPLDFANTVFNAAAGQTAIRHRLTGPNATLGGGPVAGLQALGYAADLVRSGQAGAILAGGVDELSPEAILRVRARRSARAARAAARPARCLSRGGATAAPSAKGRSCSWSSRLPGRRGAAPRFSPKSSLQATAWAPPAEAGDANAPDEAAQTALARAIAQVFEQAENPAAALDAWSASASGAPSATAPRRGASAAMGECAAGRGDRGQGGARRDARGCRAGCRRSLSSRRCRAAACRESPVSPRPKPASASRSRRTTARSICVWGWRPPSASMARSKRFCFDAGKERRMQLAESYDVVIIGAGLAGLTLSRQLLRETDKRILLVDRWKHIPSPRQKYGEATVQLSGYYFAKVLDLEEHLLLEHLPKYNLRFYWKSAGRDNRQFEDYSQAYVRKISNVPTYQLDRNALEAELLRLNRLDRASPSSAASSRRRSSSRATRRPRTSCGSRAKAGRRPVAARWVVDSSGRGRLLARKLEMRRQNAIRHGAFYMWVDGHVNIERLTDLSWKEVRLKPDRQELGLYPFWLATNHFCEQGLWFWVIPLRGKTSLGLVFEHGAVDPEEVKTPAD
jgi:hypothetical protein